MKDQSVSPRAEAPSTSRRSVLAGLAALGLVYAAPGIFQVNEAMAEPMRKPRPHGPGHSRRSRHSHRSRSSRRSRHSKAKRRSHPSRRSHASRPGPSRRSHPSRMHRRPELRRPI